jgi:benzoyl-CoA reductase/2-hydroxyglutaryl-CoA dehydratase subunit BcrC/BadD/HgdB
MPDLLITGRLCPEMSHYAEGLYRRMNINVVGIDTPPPANESNVLMLEKFCEAQVREVLIPTVEKICGKPFDYDRLREILVILKETCLLRNECWEYFKKIPSPWTLWDYGVSIAPVFYMMGSPDAVPYYTKLRDELAERAEKNIGAIEPEDFRVYWDGWLPWGFLGQFSRKMTSLGIVPLVGRYPWEFFPHPETIDLNEDPVVTFAKQVYSYGGLAKQNLPNMSLPTLHKWIDEYRLDGVIMFSSKSCRMWNLGHPDFIKAIERKNGIPGVIIEGDMVDSRMNSFAQIDTRLEAFAEMMAARKKSRKDL